MWSLKFVSNLCWWISKRIVHNTKGFQRKFSIWWIDQSEFRGVLFQLCAYKFLGVTISVTLTLSSHVTPCSLMGSFPICLSHCMCPQKVSRTNMIGRLTYVCPSLLPNVSPTWGVGPLEAVVSWMVRRHLLPPDQPLLCKIIDDGDADMLLFR